MEFYLGIAILTLSLTLLLRAFINRRVGDTPFCRKCKFELTGLTDPSRCPECGRELNSAWAIRIGKGRVRMRPMWWGLALAFLGGAFIGIDALNRNGKFNLTSEKPAWLLYAEAYLFDDSRAGVATIEIDTRGGAGKLAAGWDDRLLELSLTRHAQRWRSLPDAQWDVIVAGARDDIVSKERLEQIYDDSFVGLGFYDVGNFRGVDVYPGEKLMFNVLMDWREGTVVDFPDMRGLSARLSVESFELVSKEGEVFVQKITPRSRSSYGTTASVYDRNIIEGPRKGESADLIWEWGLPDDFEPGVYTARVAIGYVCIRPFNFQPPGGIPLLEGLYSTDISRVIEREFAVTVAPVGSNDPTSVRLDDLGTGTACDLMRFAITDKDVIFGHTPVVEYQIGVVPRLPPVWLLGELVFIQGDLEYRVAVFHNGEAELERARVLLTGLEAGDVQVRYEHLEDRARRRRDRVGRVFLGPVELGTYTMPTYQQTLDAQGPGR